MEIELDEAYLLWRYAKHILYHYRGVSQYHFPMYLKEIEY